MTIPVWLPATTYVPGSLVVPSSSAPVTQPQPANADFETGDLTGWTATGSGTWANSSTTPYIGTHCVLKSGSGYGTLTSTTLLPVQPGQVPTATAYFKLTNAGTDDQGVQVQLIFLDSGGSPIGVPTVGNSVVGVGGAWKPSVASGPAPSGATHFVVALYGNNGTNGGTLEGDHVSVTYAYQVANPGIVYKATQAAPGKSGSSEPVWPGVVGVPVTDNQVTWEGEYATRLVWQASALLQSGATEPTWPTQAGAAVHDGTIDWIARTAQITDPNCPQSKIVAIGAGKIFAADNDIVRYCATVNPLDWTAPNDAGYLPTGLQTYGSNSVAAMGLYRSNLVVYNAEGFQMWQLDPDPANIALLDALPVASTHNPALAPTANDLFFLASQGVRSMGIASAGVNLESGDVGMPIDALVKPALTAAMVSGIEPVGTYIPAMGQYWLSFANYPPQALAVVGHLSNAAVNVPLSYQYTTTGGIGARTLSITAGALPTGLSMSSSGLVTGTPTVAGPFSFTVTATDALGVVAHLNDTTAIQAAGALTLRAKVTSWWDFESSLADQARGGNNQSGSVSYVPNGSGTGNMLAAGTVPLSTTTTNGFNYYVLASQYSTCAFGARLSVSTLSNATTLLTVGTDTGSVVSGLMKLGIDATGHWSASIYDSTGVVIASVLSPSVAVINTDTHVGLNMLINGARNQMELRVNGVAVATSATFTGAISTNVSHFVIGTREGTGYQPKVSEMFWAHDVLVDAEWLYLYNAGNKRFFADFGALLYGTTFDAFIASLMAAKNGAIYKMNDGTGTSAVDSSTFGPIGSASLLSGAAYTNASAPPAGFGSDPVVYLDGVNDRVQTPTYNIPSGGPGVESVVMWFKQATNAVPANSCYFDSSDPAQSQTGRNSIMQGSDATKMFTRYNDFSGNVFPSGTAITPSRLSSWYMLSFAGFNSDYCSPVVNGIVMASPFHYSPGSNGGPPNKATFGAYVDGTLAINGYISRSCICTTGNFSLPQLAQLYDLGMGIG